MLNYYARLAILGFVGVFAASGTQISGSLSGLMYGDLNGNTFSAKPFILTFSTDTALLFNYAPGSFTTPAGTAMTFSIATVGSGVLVDDEALFVNQGCQCAGFSHYLSFDVLDFASPALATWDLASVLGPIPVDFLNSGSSFAT